jgi:hypothetical protein
MPATSRNTPQRHARANQDQLKLSGIATPPESSTATERVKMELVLTRGDYDRLQKVARELSLSVGEVLQRSIATALFLQEQIDKGSKILIQDRKGRRSEFGIM